MIRIIVLCFFLVLPQKLLAEPDDVFYFMFFGSHLKKTYGHAMAGLRG